MVAKLREGCLVSHESVLALKEATHRCRRRVGEGLSREKWRKRVEFSLCSLGHTRPARSVGVGVGDSEVCRLCLLAGVENVGKSLRVCWQGAFRHL